MHSSYPVTSTIFIIIKFFAFIEWFIFCSISLYIKIKLRFLTNVGLVTAAKIQTYHFQMKYITFCCTCKLYLHYQFRQTFFDVRCFICLRMLRVASILSISDPSFHSYFNNKQNGITKLNKNGCTHKFNYYRLFNILFAILATQMAVFIVLWHA